MTKEECLKGMKYLGLAYGTDGFNEEEVSIYYDFLQPYSYDVFRMAVKNLIKKTKFMPKISEIIDECNSCKETTKYTILNFMQSKGYFKTDSEIDKATKFLETGCIPEWFKNDMKKYKDMMNQKSIDNKKQPRLENK